MIQEDEYIIFASEAKCAVALNDGSLVVKTGLRDKKIVITTRRCLFFESLSNMVSDIEFEIVKNKKKLQDNNPKKKEAEPKKRISINEYPEYSFNANDREARIMIAEENSCINYLTKIGLSNLIQEVTGLVVLKNHLKMKFELMSFKELKDGFRFCKALACAKAWIKYENYCKEEGIQVNRMWVRIASDISSKENSIVLIDPELFVTGSKEEIKSFHVLLNELKFIHSFEHRYSITNSEICQYALEFIEMFQEKTNSLTFKFNNLNVNCLDNIFHPRLKLENLMNLNLSNNKLTDEVFFKMERLVKDSKKLSYFNLSHNLIRLIEGGTLFLNFLKAVGIMQTLDLSYNEISDNCIDIIEKYVIFPTSPPIQEINFSFNKIGKKITWRLFLGNQKHHKYHSYMNFIIYPLPFKEEIFPEDGEEIEYPRPNKETNFNMHSALIEEFEQESFMQHTLKEVINQEAYNIKLIRYLDSLKLPRSKEEVHKSYNLANKMENFIYSSQYVENMHDLADEIGKFEYNLPPVSKARFTKYLADKLNEALFIRDHYSVKFLLMAFKSLKVDYSGYQDRIKKVEARNTIICQKMENIMNFEVDEANINLELDNVVKEGLKLFLTGNGIETLYYLKYKRDEMISKLIMERENPENYINTRLAEKNMNYDDEIQSTELIIPYEIRVEKNINENFYLHPWKTNYLVLSQIIKEEFDNCLKFLEKSSKKEKFAKYFERIEERIEFMKNEFYFFSNLGFKISYNDLKINCARLLAMYNFIGEKHFFLDIPTITRKVQVKGEKIIPSIDNESRFIHDNNISQYPNINKKARNANFYNYHGKYTRYSSEVFNKEFSEMKDEMDKMLAAIERTTKQNNNKIAEEIINNLYKIFKFVKQATYPEQLKEEFYLKIICWRNRNSSNTEILRYAPFLTMYLRPPHVIDKFLVAAIVSNRSLKIGELPLSIVTDVTKSTDIKLIEEDKNYVDRDWMVSDKEKDILVTLMKDNGKIEIEVQLLTKKTVSVKQPESKNVKDIVNYLIEILNKDIEDVYHYWLYMGYVGDTNNLVVLEEGQHLGELICEKSEKPKFYLFKRRIYCPEWKYLYRKYSESMINNLFYDIKREYLQGEFFIRDSEIIDFAAILILIDLQEKHQNQKETSGNTLHDDIKNIRHDGYIPIQAASRSLKTGTELTNSLRKKVNEKIMKKEHLKTLEMKKEFLKYFENQPEFLCSNYIFADKNKKMLKVSINWLQIIINSETTIEKIKLEQIISIVPFSKYLLIHYHKSHGTTLKENLFGDENKILSTAHDLLTYCMIRVKMLSTSLYSAYRYESLMEKYINIKEPSKDPEVHDMLRRIKKKLGVATPTILEENLIIYQTQNKYVKSYKTRKLYPNASLEKIDQAEDDGDEMEEIENRRNHGVEDFTQDYIFNTMFPNASKHIEDKRREESVIEAPSMYERSFSEQPSMQAYNSIGINNQVIPEPMSPNIIVPSGILEDPILMKEVQNNSNINKKEDKKEDKDEPPELTPIKQPAVIDDDNFSPITTAGRTRARGAPKKNR